MGSRFIFRFFFFLNEIGILGLYITLCYFVKLIYYPEVMLLIYLMYCVGIGFLLYIFFGLCFVYMIEESDLIRGESHQIRKHKRKILKSKRKIKEMKLKNDSKKEQIKWKKEELSLQCELKQLENEYKQEYYVCKECGTKVSIKACFCSHCGNVINK